MRIPQSAFAIYIHNPHTELSKLNVETFREKASLALTVNINKLSNNTPAVWEDTLLVANAVPLYYVPGLGSVTNTGKSRIKRIATERMCTVHTQGGRVLNTGYK